MNDVLEILIKNGELDERIIESRTPNYAHLMIDPNVMFDSSSSPLIEPPDTSLLAFSDDYSILSPMQPMQEDHHIDHIDHNGETIDKLLGQAQNNIPLNSMHLPSTTAKYQPMLQESVREPPSHNLTDFTDIDYMEFPMEIEEPQKEGHCDSSSNSLNNCYGENDLLDRFANTGKNPSMHRSVDENHQQLILNSFIECLSNNNNPICAGNPYLTSNIYGQKSMLGKEQLLVNDPSNITPMDFDNILSFDLQANDSFDSHNDSYMNNNLLNDDYRMNNGDTIMNCEVDNLLCNI